MSEDLIKRSDAIDALRKLGHEVVVIDKVCSLGVAGEFIDAIRTIPSADKPQGEWIYGEHDVAMCDGYRCDRCGFFVPWDYEHKFIDFINDYHYCPSCGARMKGADDE